MPTLTERISNWRVPKVPWRGGPPKPVTKAAPAEADTTSWWAGGDHGPTDYSSYLFRSPAVHRATSVRADAVASARLIVGEATRDVMGRAEFQRVPNNHPAQDVLDRVNPWYTRSDLWRTVESQLLLYGQAFIYANQESFSPASWTLWPLKPNRVTVLTASRGVQVEIAGYRYEAGGGRAIELGVDAVVPFWKADFRPGHEYAGVSALQPGRLSAEMGLQALIYNERFFKNGATPGDIAFVVPGMVSLPEAEIEAFYKRLDQRFRGAKNAHKPIMIPGSNQAGPGITVEKLGISQKDMEFKSALDWSVEDIARCFGVPPPMMFSGVHSTYNNVREWQGDFWRSTVMPEWDFLASKITERLLPMLGYPELTARFDYTNLPAIQESMVPLRAADRADSQIGLMTINEVREKRGLPPVEWGDAPAATPAVPGAPVLGLEPAKANGVVTSFQELVPERDGQAFDGNSNGHTNGELTNTEIWQLRKGIRRLKRDLGGA